VKLLYAIASALFCVAAPVAAPAQSLDLSLMSALCSDDYYEDTAGQCSVISAVFILTKYGIVISADTDEDVIVLYLDDLEDTPVGSIQALNEDAVSTDEKSNPEPANEQETIVSRAIVLEAPSAIDGEAAVDVATTGPIARSVPAAEAVDDHTIE
jgi:hypothetical protein